MSSIAIRTPTALPFDASRRRKTLGERGPSNPNNLTNICEKKNSASTPTPSTKHHIPETVERVISILQQKLAERHACGPSSFLKLFRDIDVDNGGTIDRDELKTFLEYYHLGSDKEVFEQVFQRFDPDNSGDIDMSEFLETVLNASSIEGGEGLLQSRQVGGSREFHRMSPEPKDVAPLSMSATKVIDLVREKVESRTPSSGGALRTSYQLFKQGKESISKENFFDVLETKFNIVLLEEKVKGEVWGTFDTDNDGKLSFEEFIEHFIVH